MIATRPSVTNTPATTPPAPAATSHQLNFASPLLLVEEPPVPEDEEVTGEADDEVWGGRGNVNAPATPPGAGAGPGDGDGDGARAGDGAGTATAGRAGDGAGTAATSPTNGTIAALHSPLRRGQQPVILLIDDGDIGAKNARRSTPHVACRLPHTTAIGFQAKITASVMTPQFRDFTLRDPMHSAKDALLTRERGYRGA